MMDIIIKITRSGRNAETFDITDNLGNTVATNVSLDDLINGVTHEVDDSAEFITLTSVGNCSISKTLPITVVSTSDLTDNYVYTSTSCLWRHLTDEALFNNYYGVTEPYIIEYPFSYVYHDEVLQNVKDYTKAYQYLPDGTGVFNPPLKIETDNLYFNKAVLYNGQQSTGILELAPKPKNNLKLYMSYPIYRESSKEIIFTKSDNFYQYNTFWDVRKDKSQPLFIPSCETLSIDKEVNQDNMDYSPRTYKKAPLRAKDVRIRHILDNRSDVHLVSQFIFAPAQISYK